MTRGGRHKEADGPERRCIATGERGDPARMVRFVLGPDGDVVPDVAGRLPGRGVWLTAEKPLVEKAVDKRLFSRGFKAQAAVPEGLVDLVERLLVDRLVSTLGLARKAGEAVTGFEKVKARLLANPTGVLVQASDGAPDQRAKLARLAQDRPLIGVLNAAELGLAFGRGFAIHATLDAGGLASRALSEAQRIAGFRPETEVKVAGDPTAFGKLNDNGARSGLAQDIG
ncbi:MAG: RNA-binding protein [Pseudomonadota bacterium]